MKTDNDREKDNSVRLSVTIAFGDQQHSTDGLVYRQVHFAFKTAKTKWLLFKKQKYYLSTPLSCNIEVWA